jgi:protein-S-isoprenylcysteine O-methyltransferase Ste14
VTIYTRIIGICWLAFFAVWFVAMLRGGGRTQRYSPGAGLVRLLLVVTIALGAVFGRRLTAYTFASFTEDVAAVGCALCILGLAFAVWARVTLGRNWGMPMTLHESPELVTSGPYRFVRHPIYTGMAAMAIGTALVFPLAALWAVAMIVYVVLSARREERDMERQFPDAYPAYKQRSKMLVPFLI